MIDILRCSKFIAIVSAFIMAGCSGNVEEAGADESGGSDVAASASSEVREAYQTYLAAASQDPEACFKELPDLEDTPAGGALDDGRDGPVRPVRVVMALDASGSMAGRIGGESKMTSAKEAAGSFLGELPDEIAVGLVAFGHKGDNSDAGKALSCQAVETVHPLTTGDRNGLQRSLASFGATGWTPLAAAIEQAGSAFTEDEVDGAQVVYVVSDGEETCGGDPVAAARTLHEGGTHAIINIIGFDLAPGDRAQLRSVAQAGGGDFIEVRNRSEFRRWLDQTRRNVANSIARNTNSIVNTRRINSNKVRTNTALARANTCISTRTARENIRLTAWARENEMPRDVETGVRELLAARKAGFQERLDRIERSARQRLETTNSGLAEDREKMQREFEQLNEGDR